ncbi:MAG TPA: DCC1-like thiol-disulfide oxidoreductase family protein [Gemmatimonadaceae bacterium]|nr:DCC1-like thiol-disulfide oxidoreductase family protein [Gemmatimonadaceae bacterium]
MATPRQRSPIPQSGKPRGRGTSLAQRLEEHGLILLYDGHCGLCNRTVRWVLKRDPGGTMCFAPLSSAVGREALSRLPSLAGIDSVILLHKEGAWVKSAAVLEIARYVGGIWGLATLGYVVPRALRDWCYDFVARRRYGWFGRLDSCPLPPPEDAPRFLGA